MKKILISLTVIHTRLSKLHLTLQSLLAQDYANFEVRVHASHESFLLDQGAQEVPEAVQALLDKDARLSWRWVPNIGSYRKLLPVLSEMIDEDQIIVTADDDTLYPPGWLTSLAQYHALFNCVVSYRGHFIATDNGAFAPYRSWMTHGIIENPSELVLPTGKDGVLYHTSYFDRRVLDYVRALELAPTADDLWFKWHTAVNKVPVYCIEPDYTKGSLVETVAGPSLYLNFNDQGANDRTAARLHEYALREWGFDLTTLSWRPRAASNHFAPARIRRVQPSRQPSAIGDAKTAAGTSEKKSSRPERSTGERIVREMKRFFRRMKPSAPEKPPPATRREKTQ